MSVHDLYAETGNNIMQSFWLDTQLNSCIVFGCQVAVNNSCNEASPESELTTAWSSCRPPSGHYASPQRYGAVSPAGQNKGYQRHYSQYGPSAVGSANLILLTL